MATIKRPAKLTMRAGSFYIPKNNPSKPKGEDAHFISHKAQVIAVADGVGGWAASGIDAGKYARQLMRNTHRIIKEGTYMDPTACIITLAADLLLAANLGDSGFMVIRGGEVFYRSPVQQHSFNFPYQMGRSSGGAEAAEELAVPVEDGDVVVVGTDGLFDNVFPEDIVGTVGLCLEKGSRPSVVARKLAKNARRKSLDRRAASPFELAAYEAGVPHFGGKYDDITVVVAFMNMDHIL